MYDNEIWKDIPGYEGMYRVSDMGRVESLHRVITRSNGTSWTIRAKILKPYLHKGYWGVNLCNDSGHRFTDIHLLVALAFLGPRPGGYHTHHKDGDKTNNNVENLEYKQLEEHHSHHVRGSKHPLSKIDEETARQVKHLMAQKVKRSEIVARTGVSVHIIKDIQRERTWWYA